MALVPLYIAATFAALFLGGFAVFRHRRRRSRVAATPIRREPTAMVTRELIDYVYWLAGPAERALEARGVSPNALTLGGLAISSGAGALAAVSEWTLAGIAYFAGGALDILDGRVARRTGRSTPSGALLDSVCDRWGEFAVLGGIGLAVRDETFALAAVLLATAGSQMVSYTRARAEALGVSLAVGLMQRSERIILVGLGLVVAGGTSALGPKAPIIVLAATLLAVGVMSTATSIRRLRLGASALDGEARKKNAA